MNNTSVEITAGLGGFLVVFALALTVWLLSRDLSKRLRRMRLKEQERLAALQRDHAGPTPAPGGGVVAPGQPPATGQGGADPQG